MNKKFIPEKILIIIALALFAGIIFYNAFYIPSPTIPTVIYLDKGPDESSQNANKSVDENENPQNSNNSDNAVSISEKININTADVSKLDELPGVGEAIAKKIIEYREYNGNFSSIEEIKNVSGIGESKFEKMKDYICVWLWL